MGKFFSRPHRSRGQRRRSPPWSPHPQEPVYGQGRRGDPEQATGAFATRLDDIQGPLKLSPGLFLDGVQAAWLHPEKFA